MCTSGCDCAGIQNERSLPARLTETETSSAEAPKRHQYVQACPREATVVSGNAESEADKDPNNGGRYSGKGKEERKAPSDCFMVFTRSVL